MAFQRPYTDLTREERLWYLRTQLEGHHRFDMYMQGVMRTYTPSIHEAHSLPAMGSYEFITTCNKSVPIYLMKGCWLLKGVLHNYVYRRWFKPYRSEIEHQRFICKFIQPKDAVGEASPSQSTINNIAFLHRSICAEVETCRRTYIETITSGAPPWGIVKNHQSFILQPLFQALLIIISPEHYNGEDSKTLGRLPVFLVRTGVGDGLSAPITFEPIADKIIDGYTGETTTTIKTTLETAIDFVIYLEAREATAFGLQPDPVAAWDPDTYLGMLRDEWEELVGDEPLVGPTSRFVDTDKYPEWLGSGQVFDSTHMVVQEQRELRHNAEGRAGETS
ncbi:hypothetical protein PT974_06423 [Cladobotryum mycophilum]|uniref:Uncharacterized protein n=1 Tax=Cladobotryum mycophilum TaxID=491253 RepID=A0ABR0SLD9_9HYPO